MARGTAVRACISCHLSTGHGHPENSRLPGASAGYIARQLAEFKSGVRKGAANMLTFSKAMSDEEMKIAAEYFASLPVKRWTRVVETDTVPKTYFLGTRRMPLREGGTEPIGTRVIEVPEDPSASSCAIPIPASSPTRRPAASPRASSWSRPAATARPLPAPSATARRSRASARCRASPASRR